MFKYFPQNHIHNPAPPKQDSNNFTKVQYKKNKVKRGNPSKQPSSTPPNPSVNSFEVLAKLAKYGDPSEELENNLDQNILEPSLKPHNAPVIYSQEIIPSLPMPLTLEQPIIYSQESIPSPLKTSTLSQPIIPIPYQDESSYHHVPECNLEISTTHITLPKQIYNPQEMVMKEFIP